MDNIMSYFPLETPRESQRGVIEATHKIFNDYDVVILEGPVGSGKSAIAETLARAYESAHILTPRKSLQDQYMEDFKQFGMVTMKGKSSYPCYPTNLPNVPEYQAEHSDAYYHAAVQSLGDGETDFPGFNEGRYPDVGKGFCVSGGKKSATRAKQCQEECGSGEDKVLNRPCPFAVAVSVAQCTDQVVHNLHSFLFQNYYGHFFDERNLLVIDEAHELEGIVRDFVSTTFNLPMLEDDIPDTAPEMPAMSDEVEDWGTFLSWEGFVPNENSEPEAHEKWVNKLEFIQEVSDTFLKDCVIFKEDNHERNYTKVTFMPENMGGSPANLFFQYGNKVLLMSGTIYDKNYFCRKLGIDPDKAAFIRLTSEFPLATRPIVMETALMTNNSFASWRDSDEAYRKMLRNIATVLERHPNEKGLIHAPSYKVAQDLCKYLRNSRLVTHDDTNFKQVLDKFYASKKPQVLVSPICQQGVDFKYDRARFQLIIRVPFLNTSDPFVARMMKKNFVWYNYQSLVTFGQMIGRVNRAPDDQGVTYLMDSRFKGYISKNKKLLPAWLTAAIQRV